MSKLAHSTNPIPAYNIHDFVSWTVSAQGEMLSIFGGGSEYVDPSTTVGTYVRDMFAPGSDMLELHTRLIFGESISEIASDGRRLWWVTARPVLLNGRIIGATGVSFPLQPEEVAEQPRERVFTVEGLPNSYRGPLQNGDTILKVDGVPGATLARDVSDEELIAATHHIELLTDSRPSHSYHLRLLP